MLRAGFHKKPWRASSELTRLLFQTSYAGGTGGMLKHRRYRSGSTWALWRWVDVRFADLLYLRRLHLLHTPWGGLMVNWIPNPTSATRPRFSPKQDVLRF